MKDLKQSKEIFTRKQHISSNPVMGLHLEDGEDRHLVEHLVWECTGSSVAPFY